MTLMTSTASAWFIAFTLSLVSVSSFRGLCSAPRVTCIVGRHVYNSNAPHLHRIQRKSEIRNLSQLLTSRLSSESGQGGKRRRRKKKSSVEKNEHLPLSPNLETALTNAQEAKKDFRQDADNTVSENNLPPVSSDVQSLTRNQDLTVLTEQDEESSGVVDLPNIKDTLRKKQVQAAKKAEQSLSHAENGWERIKRSDFKQFQEVRIELKISYYSCWVYHSDVKYVSALLVLCFIFTICASISSFRHFVILNFFDIQLLEIEPNADTDSSYFVKEDYGSVSALLGEDAQAFLGLPLAILQIGHFIGAIGVVLCAFIEYPGFPLTNLPSSVRAALQGGKRLDGIVGSI